MTPKNLATILDTLDEFNFEKSDRVPDRLKCVKCRKILRNACQMWCGCQFCIKCVDELMVENVEMCIGNSEDCGEARLSDHFPDTRANKDVLGLLLKCPMESCKTECALIDMADHLRLCPGKAMQCAFFDLGCDRSRVEEAGGSIAEHYCREQDRHSRMIVEAIGSVRNEISEKNERGRAELDVVKKNLSMTAHRVRSLFSLVELKNTELLSKNKEIQSITKRETSNLKQRAVDFENQITLQIDRINKSIESINDNIKSIKVEMSVDSKQMLEKILCLDNKIVACQQTKPTPNVMAQNHLSQLNRIALHVNRFPIATFDWSVDRIMTNNYGLWFNSESFSSCIYPIEMSVRARNQSKYFDVDLSFDFSVSGNMETDDEADEFSTWDSCQLRIGMKIFDYPNRSIAWATATRRQKFLHPIGKTFNLSKPFRVFYKNYYNEVNRDTFGIIAEFFVYLE